MESNPFRDIPRGHWSLAAVKKLVDAGLMEGFPDGTFKGTKVMTRYDFALHLARLLARLEKMEKERRARIPPEQMLTITRLTQEYRNELRMFGVKIDNLEERIGDLERRTDKLERRSANVRIDGFYRITQYYVVDPFDFSDYPYVASRNEYRNLKDRGLYNLSHAVYLRFYGQPYIEGEIKNGIESFAELKGVLSGIQDLRLDYSFSDPPVAGDSNDDFATGIVDEKRVSLNKAHLKIRSKTMEMRAFANESITELDDPAKLMVWRGNHRNYYPDQGVEFKGKAGRYRYFGAVHKDLETSSSSGDDPANVGSSFSPVTQYTVQDVFSGRVVYDTAAAGSRKRNNVKLGTTYVETIYGYDKPDDYNSVLAFDVQFQHRSEHKFDLAMEHMLSEGRGDIHDTAFKLDSTYRRGDLLFLLKTYAYGYNWKGELAQDQIVDKWVSGWSNFGRDSSTGEHLIRTELRYDFKNRLISGADKFQLNLLWETKWFERDPSHPKETDEVKGLRAYVQALIDLNDKTHFELKTEKQKDVFPGEKGKWIHSMTADYKITSKTSMVGRLKFVDDYDVHDDEGRHYTYNMGEFSLNVHLNDWLFVKPYTKFEKEYVRSPDGKETDRWGLESTVTFRKDLSLKTWLERMEVENPSSRDEDGTYDTIVGELAFNFTRAFKMRYVRGIKDIDRVTGDDEFYINNYLELLYRPTEQTEIRFTYGYEYENSADWKDDGPLEFWKNEQIVKLSAQTDF